MQDLYYALIVSGTIVAVAFMVTRVVSSYYRQKVEVSKRMAYVRSQKTSKSEKNGELGKWVYELLDQLGHSPEELYEDEPPEELEELLSSPMVAGLLKGIQKGNAAKGEGEEAQTSGLGGWF